MLKLRELTMEHHKNAERSNFAKKLVSGKIDRAKCAKYQKQNPHTPRTMASLGLDENDVKLFIDKCLFPEVK